MKVKNDTSVLDSVREMSRIDEYSRDMDENVIREKMDADKKRM